MDDGIDDAIAEFLHLGWIHVERAVSGHFLFVFHRRNS
jgi:hypothetical protein